MKGDKIMSLGEKILQLRKQKGFSQEQLGELVNVTRQTISNWELGDTAPNPEQLKTLSKIFQISIDELLDNETETVLMQKVSNTEKLAGIIIKILKVVGVILIVYLVICLILAIIGVIMYTHKPKATTDVSVEAVTVCELDDITYQIQLSDDGSFSCDRCNDDLNRQLQEGIDFNHLDKSVDYIENYFSSRGGTCHS